jgi:hypothetical protein
MGQVCSTTSFFDRGNTRALSTACMTEIRSLPRELSAEMLKKGQESRMKR